MNLWPELTYQPESITAEHAHLMDVQCNVSVSLWIFQLGGEIFLYSCIIKILLLNNCLWLNGNQCVMFATANQKLTD